MIESNVSRITDSLHNVELSQQNDTQLIPEAQKVGVRECLYSVSTSIHKSP